MKHPWTPKDTLAVYLAIQHDEAKGWAANINVTCPICETDSLSYDRTSFFTMTAWCRECGQGIRQGDAPGGPNFARKGTENRRT